MVSFGLTDKGQVRKNNQDSFTIETIDDKTLLIVCDGIGGNRAGEVASAVASKDCQMYFSAENQQAYSKKWLTEMIKKVNDSVYGLGDAKEEYKGMGTTLVGALVTEKNTYVANVGDSRCYVLDEDDKFTQVSEDHTIINFLVKNKGFSLEAAQEVIKKNYISRAIGVEKNVEVDTFEVVGDYKYILLCSDGLHGYVSDETIREVLLEDISLEQKCQKLVKFANAEGGFDNITVVIYER